MAGPANTNERAMSAAPALAATAPTIPPAPDVRQPPAHHDPDAGRRRGEHDEQRDHGGAHATLVSRRYSLRNWDCGPANTLKSSPVVATSSRRR